ncbi:MAG: bifunctional [glutamate--ammonia ligase]-adenylyl-L-tyrosine phosphorylase/[glutamate--ammonia-ligase] adenylyltransferase [Sinobacteraceae bacterium]|nr:bifunctional [glutamate--ammonia ligase]-adenylyl-L-tyrosine phosphorylase/[glutamate--ammonia-ligase] adenylyltransferase [Nevskiaceae bacterium]
MSSIADLPAPLAAAAPHVLACSEFVATSLERDPALLDDLLASDALRRPRTAGGTGCWPGGQGVDPAADEAACQSWLRRWRRREMVRIAWRDLAGDADLQETLEDLSAFADDAIGVAYECAWRSTTARYGTPRSEDGSPVPMVVVGMGKLGGRELNYSSDIDLVFLFPEHGETDHTAPVSHDEFFIRLGQALMRLLSAQTVDGFVFRVDMRLRPFGDSGPLACSFASFEDYLVQHGRDWERYAWIKARPITAPTAYAELYHDAVRPFVFRRYLDFGVFESLREMKTLIERQVMRREMADHIKLGPGGIREIEFIVQAFQLIRGGQDRRLQNPRLLEVLPLLAGRRLLSAAAVDALAKAYRYLRTLENRLQMIHDAQVHQLPIDPPTRERLTRAMHEPSWDDLRRTLEGHRERVQAQFHALVFGPVAEPGEPAAAAGASGAAASTIAAAAAGRPLPDAAPPAPLQASLATLPWWEEGFAPASLCESLEAVGLREAAEVARLLVEFRAGALLRRLDATSARRLHRLMPELLEAVVPQPDPLPLFKRFLRVIEAIGPRSTYFALLNENPAARRRFVDICLSGDFLAGQVAAHPLLLDELLDDRVFGAPATRAEFAAELAERIARVDAGDPERLVEALCQFKRAAIFRIAIGDLTGTLPLMRVSDRLTDVAELILEQAMVQGWTQLTAQFGRPMCSERAGAARREVRICAVGYGKLGGIELGYASDLDLVFLHDSSGEVQETDGPQPIDNQVFFVRFAQRIVHLLTMHSAAGRLYAVDVRLRPSGKGGMLITQIDAFADYQRQDAWTWEHQALLHARAVAGSPELRAEFERIRLEIITRSVRRDTLQAEVRAMRERMRRELSKAKAGEFDLKQGSGGIADIEFLAQYWALRWAESHPAVAIFPDTIRQLETLASGDLVPQATVDVLTRAYRRYRERGHHRSLQDSASIVADTEFAAERAAVRRIWDETFGSGL